MSSTARESEKSHSVPETGGDEGKPPSLQSGRVRRNPVPPLPYLTPGKKYLGALRESAGEELWNDWHWQMKSRITTADELGLILPLSKSESSTLRRSLNTLRMAITPYYASLID